MDCHIGIDVGDGKVVNVRRIRYFPTTEWLVASKFLAGVIFEGSTDGFTYTQIGEIDQTVHTGWNSILVETATNYRYIRMSDAGGTSDCKIGEMEIFGVEMSDVTVADITSFTTSAEVTDGLNTYTLTDVIEYRQDKTPIVSSLNMRTGSIYGSETLEITGVNLNIGTAEVVIDGVSCAVNSGATTATHL